LNHDREAYEWHHISSIIIFFVVVFLVLSGVWFSWMQFRLAHHHAVGESVTVLNSATTNQTSLTGTQAVDAAAQKDSVTEFSASPQGIKIASSAIGVVILVISMCFFYLYLEKVYPIIVNPVGQSSPSKQPVGTE
jgi:hypothetical protein